MANGVTYIVVWQVVSIVIFYTLTLTLTLPTGVPDMHAYIIYCYFYILKMKETKE